MTVTVTHSTIATLPDEPGAEVNKAEWNADHSIAGLGTAAEANTGDFEAAGAIAAHEAAADPHATAYLSPAEGDAAYAPLAHDHTGAGQALIPVEALASENSPANRYIWSALGATGEGKWITTVIYPATSVSLITGTLNAGSITSFATRNDADIYDVQEVTGVPGIDIRVSFANVPSFNLLRFQVDHICGTGTHKVEYALWNVTLAQWDLLTSLRTTNGFVETEVNADNFIDYIDTGASNTVICRMYHPITGAGTHRHLWEYMVLVDSIAGGGGISEHAALSGLDVAGSHPATAISNIPAGSIAATDVQAAINELDGDVVAHKDDLGNPHATTKVQVGLTNVTDDAQLKLAAGDFATFTEKVAPAGADLLLIEDSAAAGAKKKVQIANMPGAGGGVSTVTGTVPILSSGGTTPDISITDFVASGASHARGSVPDPGAVAGAVKFLREDATWQVPAGGGSGTDEVLLVPAANKTIPANYSLIVGDFYQLDSGIQLLIESNANMTIT